MKFKLFIIFLLLSNTIAFTQVPEENLSFTYGEFRIGYGISSFGEGLKEKYDAGNFSTSGGFLASVAAYHKFKKLNYFIIGVKYKSLGAFPSKGDNGQELFFNFWGAAFSVKYFPLDKNARKGLFIQSDFFFITQFTQKYRTVSNLEYNHQFAIGRGLVVGLGYDIPLKAKRSMITLGVEFEYDSRTGEVTGIGKKAFASSNFGFMAGIKF